MKARINEGKRLSQRNTAQRKIIRKILENADRHLDADEIYYRVRSKSPSISLSTVYRNLQLFKACGLVAEHQLGNRKCYETASRDKHHHLVCLSCGRVFEFKCPSSERLKGEISKKEGFKVTDAEVRLTGYCPECQENLFVGANENREKYLVKRRL